MSEETHPSGYKDIKQTLTVLACANAAGNHKCRLLIIGQSCNPKVVKYVKVFPVIFRSNKCTWVTGNI